jgi:shikimate kinase
MLAFLAAGALALTLQGPGVRNPAALDTAIARMGRSVAGRPLLTRPNPVAELERLLNERRIAYESADYVVDVERVAISEVVRRIVAAVRA